MYSISCTFSVVVCGDAEVVADVVVVVEVVVVDFSSDNFFVVNLSMGH